MNRIKADLHTHTRHSRDSTLSPAELVERARACGLDRVAVTDHNQIDGAWEAAALDPSLIIIGEEIDCAGGAHLIGLFLTELIPPGLAVQDAADRIRDQGGVVYAPHPFAYLRNAGRRARLVLSVADVVEVHNARAFAPIWNRRARHAAMTLGIPGVAGSDAHFPHEIGGAFTDIAYFEDAEGFRAGLADAHATSMHMALPIVHVASAGTHLTRWIANKMRTPASADLRNHADSPAARL